MNRTIPQVGCWYKDLQQGSVFEIVAVDDKAQTIETQLIDGELEEHDFDTWKELALAEIEEPEDWRNAYELSREDYVGADETIQPEDWNNPLSYIESDIINGVVDDLY